MNCIDTENYAILYVQYDSQQHRYAVPRNYTMRALARRAVDSIAPRTRKPSDIVRVFDGLGRVVPLDATCARFGDGVHLLVTKEAATRE